MFFIPPFYVFEDGASGGGHPRHRVLKLLINALRSSLSPVCAIAKRCIHSASLQLDSRAFNCFVFNTSQI